MPEISDDEYRLLKTGNELLTKLRGSPKTKGQVDRAIKTLYPDTVIDDDFDAPLREEISKLGEKVDTFLKTQQIKSDDAELDKAFDTLRKDGGYTDDGIDKIKKIMVDRKVADPLAAAAYYEKMNPPTEPQKPTSFAGTSWGIGSPSDDADVKLLFEDEDAWAEKQAIAHFNEMQKG